jgi:glycosyltransferase involved in cell wall biosynthesis
VEAGDVIIVHSELAPTMGGVVLDRLRRRGARIVYNFDDAVFLDRPGGSRLIRMLARPDRRTADLCRAGGAVMAGNRYLASYAERARGGPDNVRVMPTVLDTERFCPKGSSRRDGLPTVGWIGTHSALPYLRELFPALASVQARKKFRLQVICNRAPEPFPGLNFEFIEWALEDELAYFGRLDVGLYPLPDDPWTRGKCGFKAIQYLACGIPTIASPVGVLAEIAIAGETGLHANDPASWEAALERLLDDPGLRAEMGVAGRRLIVERYSIQAVVEEFAATLRAVA